MRRDLSVVWLVIHQKPISDSLSEAFSSSICYACQQKKALARMCRCGGSPEASLSAYVISTVSHGLTQILHNVKFTSI